MSTQEPTTQTINASQVRQHWSAILSQVFRGETRVLVEKSGLPVAALISAADLERFTAWEAQRRRAFAALERTWAAFADVPPDEVEQQVARVIEQLRTEDRQTAGTPTGE